MGVLFSFLGVPSWVPSGTTRVPLPYIHGTLLAPKNNPVYQLFSVFDTLLAP